jgi:hypothetical protein
MKSSLGLFIEKQVHDRIFLKQLYSTANSDANMTDYGNTDRFLADNHPSGI